MKFLIIGSGAREYSMGLELQKEGHSLFFAPGNGATLSLGVNVDSSICKDDANFSKLAKFALENKIDYTIVGNEAPLVDGIVDVFKKNKLKIFGPSKKAARLEGSKVFMKDFLHKYNIPTAKSLQTSDYAQAKEFIQNLQSDIVIKADGLCAGKGVIITKSISEALEVCESMLNGDSFGDAGKSIIIEEFLDGYELSVFAICDENSHILLPPSQDHKQLLDGDNGVNTGGMGAYAPTPLCDSAMLKLIDNKLIIPTLQAMSKENNSFSGVLFAGVMVVNGEPYLLEYNVRFGDPECEVLLPLLDTPFSEIVIKTCENKLNTLELKIKDLFCVGVVLASKDYPYKSSPKEEISLNEGKKVSNSIISYGGVSYDNDTLYADGGRVCVCIGYDTSLKKAQQNAYKLCDSVEFKGKKSRSDIANKAIYGLNQDAKSDISQDADINIDEHIAPLKLRYKAFFIDELIVSALIIIMVFNPIMQSGFEINAMISIINSYIYEFIALRVLYQALFTWYYGATLGKMMAKIRVVLLYTDENNKEQMKNVDLASSFLRSMFRFISEGWLLYIGFIFAHFSDRKKTLHDLISKTVVIEVY